MKTCRICKEEKSFSEFHLNKKSKDGYEYLSKLWTGVCPVFGHQITIGNSGYGSHKSGHLDRLDPSRGYTKGNVQYISGRANRIKYDAAIEELEKILEYMKRHERAETISKESTSEV